MTGRLGAWEIYENTPQAIYVCDKTEATAVTISLCNKHNASALVSIAISTNATNPSSDDWIDYDVELNAKGVLERTGVLVSPGEYVVVKSSRDYLSAVCWGVEMGDDYSVDPVERNYGEPPEWVSSVSLPDVAAGAYTEIQLEATDVEGAELQYSLTSGSLPSNLTLSTDGIISGNADGPGYFSGKTQTSTFTVEVTDKLNSVPRTFSIVKRWLDGTSAALAAPNALAIKTITGTTTNGYYYIKPAGTSTAYQVHCDMNTNGGGWMLMSFCGTGISNGAHVEDSQYSYPFNTGSTSASLTNTTQGGGTAGNLGQEFIDALIVNGREKGIACFRIEDGGSIWKNWFIYATSTARWLPVADRDGYVSANQTLSGNQWLKISKDTYIPDSGNSGAGTISGRTISWNGSNWGSFPYNMDNNSPAGENWGYSIGRTYSGNTAPNWAYPSWNSAHSSGWNRRASFWFKSAN